MTDPLIADTEHELIRPAMIKACAYGRPLYIVQMPNKKFKITYHIPHTIEWKREKLEWVRTVHPVEAK